MSKKKNFNKQDLIHIISKKIGFSKNLSKKILKDFILILNLNISYGNLNLKNFGTFKLLNKKERIGRNPKTKKKHTITARKSVSFSPSKIISENLNKIYD